MMSRVFQRELYEAVCQSIRDGVCQRELAKQNVVWYSQGSEGELQVAHKAYRKFAMLRGVIDIILKSIASLAMPNLADSLASTESNTPNTLAYSLRIGRTQGWV